MCMEGPAWHALACMHAGQGSEEHIRRQRLLALTGWSAEALKPDQAQGADVSTVQATTAALRCAMCDARVGLWNLVPEMAVVRQGGTSNHAAGAALPWSIAIEGAQMVGEAAVLILRASSTCGLFYLSILHLMLPLSEQPSRLCTISQGCPSCSSFFL